MTIGHDVLFPDAICWRKHRNIYYAYWLTTAAIKLSPKFLIAIIKPQLLRHYLTLMKPRVLPRLVRQVSSFPVFREDLFNFFCKIVLKVGESKFLAPFFRIFAKKLKKIVVVHSPLLDSLWSLSPKFAIWIKNNLQPIWTWPLSDHPLRTFYTTTAILLK